MILALKWKENLHTSICWRQHFISFLKHSPHLLSINQELLFRFSICFHFFSFSFIRIHGKLDLFQYAINIKHIWLKESRVKRGIKRLSKSAVSSIFSTDPFKYIHLQSTQSLLSNSFYICLFTMYFPTNY